MKNLIFIPGLYFLFFLPGLYAQPAPEANPHRGLYVDHFVKMTPAPVLDVVNSILAVDTNRDGIFEKEDALLQYCSENHVTYIGLYDLWQVLGRNRTAWNEYTRSYEDLEKHLCRFIEKAKNQYCVDQVGAISSSHSSFDSIIVYMNRFPVTGPYRLRPEQIHSPYFSPVFNIVQQVQPPGSDEEWLSEMLKFGFRVSDFNHCGSCGADIDVLNLELEFWFSCGTDFPGWEQLLQYMDTLKQMHNTISPNTPLTTEVYLGNMYYCTSPYGVIDLARGVDGCNNCSPCPSCPNPNPKLADRVFLSYLSGDPNYLSFFATYQFADPTTTDATDLHPLLYSEGTDVGGSANYIGAWFPLNHANNMFTAEMGYYNSWRANPATQINLPRESNIQPGGVMWFAQKYHVGVLDHPALFYSSGPVCDSGNTARVNFVYTGPGEYGTHYNFWITRDSDNAIVYPDSGNSISGITRPDAPTVGVHPGQGAVDFTDTTIFPTCILPAGNYRSHLRLDYEFGDHCGYTYEEPLYIGGRPSIVCWGDTIFCEGHYSWLHASGSSSHQWYRNGSVIPGAITSDYKAEASGQYSCLVAGPGGCNGISDTIAIHVRPNPMVHINGHCLANNTVELIANSTDTLTSPNQFGDGGVTYLWNTGVTTDRINVPYGFARYNVTITDPYSGCTRKDEIIVPNAYGAPYTLTVNPVHLPTSSCTDDGSLLAISSAPGGTELAYIWSTGASTAQISNVYPGTYSVVCIAWAQACSNFTNYTLGTPPSGGPAISGVITPVSCYGRSDGAIQITLTGGTGPFTYHWDHIPDLGNYNPGTMNQSGLYPGNYTISVFDSGGCRYQHTFTVGVTHARVNVTVTSVSPLTLCLTNYNGSATVSASGGTGPYQYLWNDPQHQVTAAATNLPSGTWRALATDANGCSAQALVSIPATPPMQMQVTDTSVTWLNCYGDSTGFLYVCASGGTPPYSVNSPWTIVDSVFIQGTGLAAGNYSFTVTDAHGCPATLHTSILQPSSPLGINTPVVSNVYCFGDSTGSVAINSYGGTYPHTLSPSATTGLAAGLYTYTLTDAAGCTTSFAITIAQPDSALNTTETHVDVACHGDQTGSVVIIPSGGTPPYSYSPGIFTGLAAGNYVYTVADMNGCVATTSFTILEPAALTAQAIVVPTSCIGCINGSIQLIPAGGLSPYVMTINPPSGVIHNLEADSLPPGIYTTCVQDMAGCISCRTDTILDDPTGNSVLNFEKLSFSIFPNPSSNQATIQLHGWNIKWSPELQVFDVTGRCVEILKLENVNNQHVVTNLSSGLYWVHLALNGTLLHARMEKWMIINSDK